MLTRRAMLAAATVVASLVMAVPATASPLSSEDRISARLDTLRQSPDGLARFLRAFPKGGDLHNHLSGAVSTESLIRYAVSDGLCIDKTTLAASYPPCTATQRPAADTNTDKGFYSAVLRAWSMEGFDLHGPESGHDHFFATFGKFGAATDRHKGDMLAEVAEIAQRQNQFYLETLISRQGAAVRALAASVGFNADFAVMRQKMLDGGAMAKVVAASKADTDADYAQFNAALKCGTPSASRACVFPIRYDYQVGRATNPEIVFANLLLGFELGQVDGRYVGVNLVQPEDDPIALRDYHLHMTMVGFLHQLYPKTRITLHAGELTPDLVPPADILFHIREAVEIAGAERIGHGVDVRHETNAAQLAREMADRHVLVETPLTSNAQILEVSGPEHPMRWYQRFGVPIGLATDDPGVSRSDITADYVRAVTEQHQTYRQLKQISRASLDHGFIQGASLWRGPDDFRPVAACAGSVLGGANPSQRCKQLLHDSPKAAAEWAQEAAFRAFEG
ncbi:adenosine deaminase [Amycolatopsis xylanica]|uniref:adenosine deaminase n=1 Tax=Amycolatopsis xylanica TaxID=589385 RepID=A0A1H3PDA6_9PSEU|nr:adenosine deaminase [Amycolatopsis xylanica]SDY98943.1 adenosine deaminase [Amycolatopsis xylanica]